MDKIKLPPVLHRYELKYLIPSALVEPITDFVLAYCDYDHYSYLSNSNFYQVNSLYFDTRSNEFLEQRRWGKFGRFNMRARSYGDGRKPPYYLEIKQKKGHGMRKYRATVKQHEWPAILNDPTFEIAPEDDHLEKYNKMLFMKLAQAYNIEPKILTRYKRRAFFSTVNHYARVTMDYDLKFIDRNVLNYGGDAYCLLAPDDMVNYDNETIFAYNSRSEGNVVLELKCNIGQVPVWMLDLITLFELKQAGFSKYMQSSLVSNMESGTNFLTMDKVGISGATLQ